MPRGPGEYYANVTYMDAQIGRVPDALDTDGIADDTVVVFTSDNGPVTERWIQWFETNAHGSTGGLRGRKHYLYEGGIRVPAIVRYPGVVEAGSRTGQAATAMDLFVTLARAGGGEVPDDRPIDGIDLLPVLAGGEIPERTLFWALDSVSEYEFALRRGDYKLLLDKNASPGPLFNIEVDPLEFFDLADSEPARVRELISLFDDYRLSIANDPLRPRH